MERGTLLPAHASGGLLVGPESVRTRARRPGPERFDEGVLGPATHGPEDRSRQMDPIRDRLLPEFDGPRP